MPDLCPWDMQTFTYNGLCTHFSHNEVIQGTPASDSPVEIDDLYEERRKVKQAMYIENKGPSVPGANTIAYGEKNLAERRFPSF